MTLPPCFPPQRGRHSATAVTLADCTAAQAGVLIERLQGLLTGAGAQADARAAVWAAFARQDPMLLATLPDGLRRQSARLLTDLLAADLNALEQTLVYLSSRPALAAAPPPPPPRAAEGGGHADGLAVGAARRLQGEGGAKIPKNFAKRFR